jgi:hypothetical protein
VFVTHEEVAGQLANDSSSELQHALNLRVAEVV